MSSNKCLGVITLPYPLGKFSLPTSLVLIVLLAMTPSLRAEGTKELAPNSNSHPTGVQNDVVAMYINSNSYANFAAFDGPADSRLHINIQDPTNECIYLGFSRPNRSSSGTTNTNAQFRIKDPNGNIIYGPVTLDASSSNITSYAQAVAGPNTLSGVTGGYTPFTVPASALTTAGDYYIEFQRVGNNTAFFIDYFDITVGSCESTNGKMPPPFREGSGLTIGPYILVMIKEVLFGRLMERFTSAPIEGYVTKIDFGQGTPLTTGFRPAAFNVAFNTTGPGNTGDILDDRMSVQSANTRPELRVFLNDPDEAICPTGTFGDFKLLSPTLMWRKCPLYQCLCYQDRAIRGTH